MLDYFVRGCGVSTPELARGAFVLPPGAPLAAMDHVEAEGEEARGLRDPSHQSTYPAACKLNIRA